LGQESRYLKIFVTSEIAVSPKVAQVRRYDGRERGIVIAKGIAFYAIAVATRY